MADASSIRKTSTPLAPPIGYSYPAAGSLPGVNGSVSKTLDDVRSSFSSSAGFYESSIRFSLNPPGYNYTYVNSNNQTVNRNTGQAYINTGAQWVPLGNVVVTVPLGASPTETDETAIFIADRPYNVVSVQGVVSTLAGSAATATLYSAPAGPTVVISGPGVGATAIATVASGIITGYVVINGGSGYGTSASAVSVTVIGTNTTGAVPGAVTLSGGAITAIATGTGGTGYQNPTAIASGTAVTGAFNLNTSANVVQTPGLNLTQSTINGAVVTSYANTQIATGARLGLVFSGAASSAIGSVTIVLQPQ